MVLLTSLNRYCCEACRMVDRWAEHIDLCPKLIELNNIRKPSGTLSWREYADLQVHSLYGGTESRLTLQSTIATTRLSSTTRMVENCRASKTLQESSGTTLLYLASEVSIDRGSDANPSARSVSGPNGTMSIHPFA